MATTPTPRTQLVSTLIAGAVAHTLFQIGWFGFGMSLAGLVATALFGDLLDVIGDAIGSEAVPNLFASLGIGADILLWVLVAMLVGSIVLVLLAVIASVSLLRLTEQRKPWPATWASLGVVAVLDLGLFWLYVWLATISTGSPIAGPLLLAPVFALIGGIAVGAGAWWGMSLVYRDKRGDTDAAGAAPTRVRPAGS